ncbi:hypothetical protein [Reyranella sp.]|uniref:hypothetical protein n=1 Tax=Reyranella sp. TaxID=1929291 RepID=UPI00403567F3
MTVAAAAGRLGCATSTVRALVDSGDLAATASAEFRAERWKSAGRSLMLRPK